MKSNWNELMKITNPSKLSALERRNIHTFIVKYIHNKNVMEALLAKENKDPNDLQWIAQLRFYWNNDVTVECMHASQPYGY